MAPSKGVSLLAGRSWSSCLTLFLLLTLVFSNPQGISGQERWRAVHVQAGLAHGSGDFIGLGASVTAELGISGTLRAFVQLTDWGALGSCQVEDALSPCNAKADLWELGVHQGLGVSERVAPFVGGAVGLHRRQGGGNPSTSSVAFSLSAGLDIAVAHPITVRLSMVHQEVIDARLEERYGVGIRFTGILVGLGVAVW